MPHDIDWASWLRRWDAQQAGYVPERETRFTAMFDVLAALLPDSFTAMDLACGPGSISQRLLVRFPAAQVLAVDMDPVMLAIGEGALGTGGGRLRWLEADVASNDWTSSLGDEQVDAVLSSTALHWLEPGALTHLYRDLGRLVRPGGVVLTADHMPYGSQMSTFARLKDELVNTQWSDEVFAERGIETAEQWWESLRREDVFKHLLDKQRLRFADKQRPRSTPSLDTHVAALHQAGFSEVGTIWQILSDRVVLAVR